MTDKKTRPVMRVSVLQRPQLGTSFTARDKQSTKLTSPPKPKESHTAHQSTEKPEEKKQETTVSGLTVALSQLNIASGKKDIKVTELPADNSPVQESVNNGRATQSSQINLNMGLTNTGARTVRTFSVDSAENKKIRRQEGFHVPVPDIEYSSNSSLDASQSSHIEVEREGDNRRENKSISSDKQSALSGEASQHTTDSGRDVLKFFSPILKQDARDPKSSQESAESEEEDMAYSIDVFNTGDRSLEVESPDNDTKLGEQERQERIEKEMRAAVAAAADAKKKREADKLKQQVLQTKTKDPKKLPAVPSSSMPTLTHSAIDRKRGSLKI